MVFNHVIVSQLAVIWCPGTKFDLTREGTLVMSGRSMYSGATARCGRRRRRHGAVCRGLGSDAGHHNPSKGEIENGSASQSSQGSDTQEEAETEDIRSRFVSTLADDNHSGDFYIGAIEPHPGSDISDTGRARFLTRHPPSPPPMTTHEATRSDPGAVIQAAPNRKTDSATDPTHSSFRRLRSS